MDEQAETLGFDPVLADVENAFFMLWAMQGDAVMVELNTISEMLSKARSSIESLDRWCSALGDILPILTCASFVRASGYEKRLVRSMYACLLCLMSFPGRREIARSVG